MTESMSENAQEAHSIGKEFTGCRFHPDRPAIVRCNKYEYSYCEDCVESCNACTDPNLYCQHRNQCFIWEVCRKEIKRRRKEGACQGLASE